MTLRFPAIAFVVCAPAIASAGNFAECLLEKLPGVQNDPAAAAAYQVCAAKWPGLLNGVDQGSGRGFFSFDSGAECALKNSSDTRSSRAAMMIRAACNRLYDRPMKALAPYNGPLDNEARGK